MDGWCGCMQITFCLMLVYDLKFDRTGCADRDTVDVGSI
jgi:hypothetical protein